MDTPPPAGFSRRMRLLRPEDFSRVYETRQSASQGPIVLYAATNQDDPSLVRLGLSVSRRIGSAVVRNRWKRRLREAFRAVRHGLPCGHDLVVVVRSGEPPTGSAGAAAMEASLAALVARVVGRRGYADAVRRPRPPETRPTKRRR